MRSGPRGVHIAHAVGKDRAAVGVMALPQTSALEGELTALVAQVRQSVALVYHRGGNGAGVIWRADGQIVTNNHVAGDGRMEVVLHDGRKYAGIVAARHPTRDLARSTFGSWSPLYEPSARCGRGGANERGH